MHAPNPANWPKAVSVIHCGPKPPSRYFCLLDGIWKTWDFSHDPEETHRRNLRRSLARLKP